MIRKLASGVFIKFYYEVCFNVNTHVNKNENLKVLKVFAMQGRFSHKNYSNKFNSKVYFQFQLYNTVSHQKMIV